MGRWIAVVLFFVTGYLSAGRPAQAQSTLGSGAPTLSGYPVTGRVVCADTQRPARFAQVTLLPASGSMSEFDRGRRAVGRTDLDGRFTIDNVPQGDYYATAELTGYVNEAGAVQAAISAGGEGLSTVDSVPRVQVSAGGGTVQLSLQRGGVFAGVVQWDDGSPAAGVSIAAVPVPVNAGATTGNVPGVQSGIGPTRQGSQLFAATDDRGRFRLSGLSPGPYVLRANLQSPLLGGSPGSGRFPRLTTLRIFAPGKQRQTEATVYTLTAGEERSDIAVTLNLNGLHLVAGQVTSTGASVHGGSVQLTDQTDSSLNRRADIGVDGAFTLQYVPPGTYTLRISASSQGAGQRQGTDTTVRFQPFQEPVTVADSDLTGVAVTVTSATGTQ